MDGNQATQSWWTRLDLRTLLPPRTIAIGTAAIISVVVLLAIVFGSDRTEAVLAFARVITQWQVLLFVLLIVFGPKIGAAVKLFLQDRDVRAKYGDTELQVTKQANTLQAPEAAATRIAPISGKAEGSATAQANAQPIAVSDAADAALANASTAQEAELNRLRGAVNFWRFQFFETYLVPRTKLFLAWVADKGPAGVPSDQAAAWFWQTNTPVSEQVAIVGTLVQLGLIKTLQNIQHLVTPLGQDYVAVSIAHNPGLYLTPYLSLFGPPPVPGPMTPYNAPSSGGGMMPPPASLTPSSGA